METDLMQDESGCKLLDAFAIRVQLCLATLGFSTLLFKRYREQPQRPLLIWGLDIGKQFMGGSVVHSLNLVASYFTGEYHQGQDANPCVWYFLNVLVDTTLGIGIVWTFLTSVRLLARHYRWKGLESGVYGSPPLSHQMKRWSQQLLVYVCALLVMKAVVVFLFYLFPSVVLFGQWILSWTMGNHRWQVVFVMFIFPLVMNTLQFWVIDTIVKHTHRPIQLPIEDELVSVYDEEEVHPQNPLTLESIYGFEDEALTGWQEAASQRPPFQWSSLSSFLSPESVYELRTSDL